MNTSDTNNELVALDQWGHDEIHTRLAELRRRRDEYKRVSDRWFRIAVISLSVSLTFLLIGLLS